jgi:hypothetical protein
MTARQRLLAGIIAAVAGALLFTYAIRDVGWAPVAAGIRRVGWGLTAILALAGIRFVLRAEAWRRCMAPDVRIPLRQAWMAYLAGDAIGNITPLGLVASEPTKVFLTRHRLATRQAASSLALDVFIYSMSVVAMITIGLIALVATLPLPGGWREGLVAGGLLLAAGAAVAWRLVGGTWDAAKGPRPAWRARLASLRESVLAFSAGHPGRLWGVFLLHALFHLCAFLEVYVTLWWLLPGSPEGAAAVSAGRVSAGGGPTLAQALIFSALDRVIIVLFKFVPFRIGVDEASSGGMAALLGWGTATGVTLAILKKVRSLAWTGVGLLLIASHPARGAPAADPPGSVRVHRT